MGLRLLLLQEASNPSFWIHISMSCVMGQLSGLWLFPSRGLFLAHMSHMSSQLPSVGKAYMKCQCGRMQCIMDSITLDMRWYKRTGSTSRVFQGWKIGSMSTCLVSSVGIAAGNTTLRSLSRRCAQGMLAALCGLGEPSEGTGEGSDSTYAMYLPLLGYWNKPSVPSASLEFSSIPKAAAFQALSWS